MTKNIRIALIDYDMGNLRSVAKAFETVGCKVDRIENPSQMKSSDIMVLPGVGAFSVAVQNLRKRKLLDTIRRWIELEKPFFGICLGYQLLFEKSEENLNGDQTLKGLGIFRGTVQKFPRKKNLRVPHIGWNQICQKSKVGTQINRSGFRPLDSGLFNGIDNGSYFYFVHSYFPVPRDKNLVATKTNYGITFVSSILKGNLFASQFHPEKSGENGLRLIKNYVSAMQ